jgi:hypothetical protein
MPFNNEDSDFDSDFDEDEFVYQPEESSTTKYNIVLCELHNPLIHGVPQDENYSNHSNSNITAHYIVNYRFKKYDCNVSEYIDDIISYRQAFYINFIKKMRRVELIHPLYRNYKAIVANPIYIKPEIAECAILHTGESVAIIKTFWLKIIQRTWRKVYFEKKRIILLRCKLDAIKYREMNGRWPHYCRQIPQLKGMLNI